jgi:hypothetical protein
MGIKHRINRNCYIKSNFKVEVIAQRNASIRDSFCRNDDRMHARKNVFNRMISFYLEYKSSLNPSGTQLNYTALPSETFSPSDPPYTLTCETES